MEFLYLICLSIKCTTVTGSDATLFSHTSLESIDDLYYDDTVERQIEYRKTSHITVPWYYALKDPCEQKTLCSARCSEIDGEVPEGAVWCGSNRQLLVQLAYWELLPDAMFEAVMRVVLQFVFQRVQVW